MKNTIDMNGKAILNINFETNKSTLMPEGTQTVVEIGLLLKNNPDLKLSIEGHTDSVGTAEYNQKLSLERAKSVVKKLEESGIAETRLKAAGFGSDRPIVTNSGDKNKAENRRVEIVKIP